MAANKKDILCLKAQGFDCSVTSYNQNVEKNMGRSEFVIIDWSSEL